MISFQTVRDRSNILAKFVELISCHEVLFDLPRSEKNARDKRKNLDYRSEVFALFERHASALPRSYRIQFISTADA